jgi:hypothetical protein
LFFERPAVVVTDEDAAAITVESQGHAEAAQQALQQVEIALRGFRGEELGGENFSEASSCMPRAVSVGPRPSSQSCGDPSSWTSSPSRAERRRR